VERRAGSRGEGSMGEGSRGGIEGRGIEGGGAVYFEVLSVFRLRWSPE
jgi:hypothetical protein